MELHQAYKTIIHVYHLRLIGILTEHQRPTVGGSRPMPVKFANEYNGRLRPDEGQRMVNGEK